MTTVIETILDTFEDLSGWKANTPGDATLGISQDRGPINKALRLDFDFKGGGGFVVAAKPFSLAIPESYSFLFQIRGLAPRNAFEFKLVDQSGQNVWRYREEAFDFPQAWQPLTIRSHQIEFAWGPLGGGPPRDVATIELVIAAGPGGKGTVWVEGMRIRDETYRLTPTITASSALPDHGPQNVLDAGNASWRSDTAQPQWLLIDFLQKREYGGLVVQWETGFAAQAFDVQLSHDGGTWDTVHATRQGGSIRSYLYLPRSRSRYIRINLLQSGRESGFAIRRIEVKPFEFSRTLNHFFESIAREEPTGLYPKYFLGRQTYWTVVGTGDGETQALMNEEGMVEVDKGSFSIEPFVHLNGRLFTWADGNPQQSLAKGYLPIPSSEWRIDGLAMKVTAFAVKTDSSRPALCIRYRLTNISRTVQSIRFYAAIRPFQVTPTWQRWQSFGGVARVRHLALCDGVVQVNGNKAVIPLSSPVEFGGAPFAEGGVTRYLAMGELPPRNQVTDEFGFASGALRFDMDLGPGLHDDVYLAVPFGMDDQMKAVAAPTLPPGRSLTGQDAYDQAIREWEAQFKDLKFKLPASAQPMADTLKTAAAHILINRDGPALCPGPRRYIHSWIRDGAIMGAAMLRIGHAGAIRDFVRWYATFQKEDGDIPDSTGPDGPEWLPEFDAYGEFIFAVMEYFRFTGDRSFLVEMWPAVRKALAFMEGLRKQRLTPEYRTQEKRACYGLLPESMSHEGYMAHPVHAYWDDFWALQGIGDAARMARILGDDTEATRLDGLRGDFSENVKASLSATIARHGIDFIPGCVELGDFDPTATAIAIALLDELDLLPRTETDNTFDKYLTGLRERKSGRLVWNNYSAYEMRIIGALVRLGKRAEAMELLEFMLADRRVRSWNQWPEISWRDPDSPAFMGDLPHTWISAEYILAVCSLFAYEREADKALVIAAGMPPEWLSQGHEVGVENLPTYYGKISYWMCLEAPKALRFRLTGDGVAPAGGIIVKPPLSRPIRKVEINGRASLDFDAQGFIIREFPAAGMVAF